MKNILIVLFGCTALFAESSITSMDDFFDDNMDLTEELIEGSIAREEVFLDSRDEQQRKYQDPRCQPQKIS